MHVNVAKVPSDTLSEQVRDGVVAMLESWAGVAPAERLLPNLADYLASPKAGGEGMVTTLKSCSAVTQDLGILGDVLYFGLCGLGREMSPRWPAPKAACVGKVRAPSTALTRVLLILGVRVVKVSRAGKYCVAANTHTHRIKLGLMGSRGATGRSTPLGEHAGGGRQVRAVPGRGGARSCGRRAGQGHGDA